MKSTTKAVQTARSIVAAIGIVLIALGASHLISNWFTYLVQFVWMDLAVFYLVHVNLSSILTVLLGAIALYASRRY